MRIARQERRRGHDLTRLAIAALRDLAVEPSLLDLVAGRCCADRLDRRDLGVANAVDGRDARTGGDTVDMHSAGAAQCHPATKLRAGHPKHVAQHPQKRGITVDINGASDTIDLIVLGTAPPNYSRESAIVNLVRRARTPYAESRRD
jgi:hypothetical protein